MAGDEKRVKVKIDHVEKIYDGRKGRMVALNGVDLDIMENEFICVVGPSGCWKVHAVKYHCRPLGAYLRSSICRRKEGRGNRDRAGRGISAVCIISMADRS